MSLSLVRVLPHQALPGGYLQSVLQNGIGRPVKQLKRLTLKFCETAEHSKFTRRFVEERLIDFASKHPSVVIYALPETDAEPQVCAEFLNGREEVKNLFKEQCDDILSILETFAYRSGVEILPNFKNNRTDFPSIQGVWHPFTHKKDYNINEKLDCSTKIFNSWDSLGSPWKLCYRKHELHKLANRPKLTYDEKVEEPLGKFGPQLPLRY